MNITNDDHKLSIDEALEHYGVKGMRWGVRRDQAALDRAAGRALTKGRGRGAQVREARASVRGNKEQIKKTASKKKTAQSKLDAVEEKRASSKRSDTISPEAKKKIEAQHKAATKKVKEATKDYEAALKKFENNPQRAVSAKMTYGEAVASALLLSPVVTAALISGTESRSAVLRTQDRKRNN